jgi:protein O-GlcNAc transferase
MVDSRDLASQNAYRVRFLPTLPYDKFMALLSLSDVMLDPFPFGGGVTTLDALSLGMYVVDHKSVTHYSATLILTADGINSPVVTLPSAQTVVQLAAGFLRYMNATEGIVDNVQEYITIAVDVASNVTKRQRIRETLLTSRDVIYEDQSAVDDWNTFLATAGSL